LNVAHPLQGQRLEVAQSIGQLQRANIRSGARLVAELGHLKLGISSAAHATPADKSNETATNMIKAVV
jgi:hypothetical protein